MKRLLLTAAFALAAWLPSGHAQDAAPAPDAAAPPALQPFVASYQAYNEGKLAGHATMRVVHNGGAQWRADLGIEGSRGFAGILGLNIQQSTVFDDVGEQYRPLSQSTVRKGLFLGKKVLGVYDWNARSAQWKGDLKKERLKPIALQDGDMNGLLIDLAIIRDAVPGKRLQYRFVELGRARDHIYEVANESENVQVGELSYAALRVSRVNGGNDETIFWVADGVPTPVRILQRENGQDGIDLRLTEYQGVN
ncbi:DUF3108 domain-containing protein [Luteimonas aquatica]|uniref:DUF3108 domain-containing protein n=1 Tax=Luteimonas aquatica TaxID=450364 RepID=UPI001F59E3C6|nr:DUF3108 domain-containing protein [Luteimonas aquatica]